MAARLGWAARVRRRRKGRRRRRRHREHCPLLPPCCRCVSDIAHSPIKRPPAHTHWHWRECRGRARTSTQAHTWGAGDSFSFTVRLRSLWSPHLFSPSSLSQVRALLLLSSIDYSIKEVGGGREGGEGGAERSHVSEWRKMTLCHVVRPWPTARQRLQMPVRIWELRIWTKTHNNANQRTCSCKKLNCICLITQPVAHMERPGWGTDGQNAATRSWTQPPSWAPDGQMQTDGVSNQIKPKTGKHLFDN